MRDLNIGLTRRGPRSTRPFFGMTAIMLAAATLGASTTALAAAPTAVTTINGTLSGAAMVPGSHDAWGVGDRKTASGQSTLVVRAASGMSAQIPAPSPAEAPTLNAVSASSATDAWAVGQNFPITAGIVTLTLHWNGTNWSRVASPTPGGQKRAVLTGVVAISAGNAWAVGSFCPNVGCSQSSTLVLHWDGTTWSHQRSPSPNQAAWLTAVDATSADNVWAVGYTRTGTGIDKTLILHWDGISWRQIASPTPDTSTGGARLSGVTAAAAGVAWAVGTTSSVSVAKTVILQWTGTSWVHVASPNPSRLGDTLTAVDATSSTDAWTVGWQEVSGGSNQILIMRWDGTRWTAIPVPTPGTNGGRLYGVAASSATNAWAVGCLNSGCPVEPSTTLLVHWDGTSWTQS